MSLTFVKPSDWSGPLQGAAWMITAAMLFAAMNGLVRLAVAAELHPFQISFLRSVFALILILPFCLGGGLRPNLSDLKTKRWRMFLLRGAAATAGVLFWVSAIAIMPLAEATAITFAAPLIAVIGSALILRETVRMRRWAAVAVGLTGVVIILKPGLGVLQPGAVIALCAAAAMATAVLCTKSLTRTEPARRIVFYTSLILTIGTLPFALFVWAPMTQEAWLLGVAMGLVGVLAHICLTRSFEAADASIVAPLDYTRLPFVALLGWVAFGEPVDATTWIGGGVIAASAIYVTNRERQLAKQAHDGAPQIDGDRAP